MKYLPLILIALLIACSAPQESTGAKELAQQLREQAEIDAAEPVETQTEEPAKTENTTAVEEVVETPVQEIVSQPVQTPEIAVVEPTPEPSMQAIETIEENEPMERTALYDFLDTFAKKVTGYQFVHKGDEYSVKGTKVKIVLDTPGVVRDIKLNGVRYGLFYYDTIYVDRVAKTAVAYCEGIETELNRQCTQMNLYDVPYAVPFSEFNIVLPEDWLFTYLDQTPARIDADKYIIQGRSAVSLTFRTGDDSTELFFDDVTGLPFRAHQLKYGNTVNRVDYEHLSANKVRDVDVIHRSYSEIPSSDYFYKR